MPDLSDDCGGDLLADLEIRRPDKPEPTHIRSFVAFLRVPQFVVGLCRPLTLDRHASARAGGHHIDAELAELAREIKTLAGPVELIQIVFNNNYED
ncbi:MAG: hypothetical protein ACREPF_11180 [Rhodanobacteraceae bacterium]